MWPQRKYLSASHYAKPFIVNLSHEEAFAAKSITSHSSLFPVVPKMEEKQDKSWAKVGEAIGV
jgi:hypothetical protein